MILRKCHTMWMSYLINLAQNKERLENCTRQFHEQNIAFTRIEAVNGRALSQDAIDRLYDPVQNKHKAKHDLVPAEIGCYASHLEAWRQIAQSEQQGGFIFEDDFAAHESLAVILKSLMADNESWDIVKLFAFEKSMRIVCQTPLTQTHQLIVPYKVPSCTVGYAIRRQAAQHLSDISIPFFRPIDEDHKFFWEKGLDVRLVTPPPLTMDCQTTPTGTIGYDRRQAVHTMPKMGLFSLGRIWRKWRYQIGYQLTLKSVRKKAL